MQMQAYDGSSEMGNANIRSLHQTTAIAKVQTAAALLKAVEDGYEHIEIQNHMDLTAVEPIYTENNNSTGAVQHQVMLGYTSPSLKSIRVRFLIKFVEPLMQERWCAGADKSRVKCRGTSEYLYYLQS